MTVLLVMAKAPVAGAVKTRLCPPATAAQAARIAAAALRDTLDAVAATPGVIPALA
ncbi:glycosyltransferase, partial [Micromonospora sp. NPDC003776]